MPDDAGYILGASGHGKVVLGILRALNMSVLGFYDDDPLLRGKFVAGLPVLGNLAGFLAGKRAWAVMGIGSGAVRKRIACACGNVSWLTTVHPASWVDPSVRVGEGTIVCAGAVVQPDAFVGRHVIINTSASVDHDCHIDDFVHVCPGVHLGGDVRVGQGSWIGIGSQVIQGVCIGANVLVGAGATVIRNIPDNAVVMGTPARIVRYQS